KLEMILDVLRFEIVGKRPIRLKGPPLMAVLEEVLARVPVEATYHVKGEGDRGALGITTPADARARKASLVRPVGDLVDGRPAGDELVAGLRAWLKGGPDGTGKPQVTYLPAGRALSVLDTWRGQEETIHFLDALRAARQTQTVGGAASEV